jgi:hypothetical protein
VQSLHEHAFPQPQVDPQAHALPLEPHPQFDPGILKVGWLVGLEEV